MTYGSNSDGSSRLSWLERVLRRAEATDQFAHCSVELLAQGRRCRSPRLGWTNGAARQRIQQPIELRHSDHHATAG
jgi:hypothetical protein